jgi:hypothetical protein
MSSRSTLASSVRNCTGANRFTVVIEVRRDTSCSRTRGECRTEGPTTSSVVVKLLKAGNPLLVWYPSQVFFFSYGVGVGDICHRNENGAANKGSYWRVEQTWLLWEMSTVRAWMFSVWTSGRHGIIYRNAPFTNPAHVNHITTIEITVSLAILMSILMYETSPTILSTVVTTRRNKS